MAFLVTAGVLAGPVLICLSILAMVVFDALPGSRPVHVGRHREPVLGGAR